MTTTPIARHDVSALRIEQALKDIRHRASSYWHTMYYDNYTDELPHQLRDALLDHVAARTVADPEPDTESSHLVLRTAAQCALGILSITTFPYGDQSISFSLIGERISSEDLEFGDHVREAASAATWLDAVALAVVSGIIWERERGIGPMLREDYAPDIRDGLPASHLEPQSDPGELAEMAAVCAYIAPAPGLPSDWPSAVLCMPAADERAEAVRQLDAIDEPAPEQRLLRVLLEDDQVAFEQALEKRLVEYRESMPADAAPRSLLPYRIIALAALAVQVHGWDLRTRSAYLPPELLRAPDGAPPAEG
ncbi:immunity 49 family protein [Streptomyces sp. NRRL F-5053]|uniref:immunity 49 family protein n=1 Tax=Streptomyces sp. NRRL F-5053 TaxID=1463854 RepID=UPI0004CA7479|nr:immunity 49 family protein [Streptomyces sp. NRRL F-5053]